LNCDLLIFSLPKRDF